MILIHDHYPAVATGGSDASVGVHAIELIFKNCERCYFQEDQSLSGAVPEEEHIGPLCTCYKVNPHIQEHRQLIRSLAERADAVYCHVRPDSRFLASYSIPAEKVIVSLNGIAVNEPSTRGSILKPRADDRNSVSAIGKYECRRSCRDEYIKEKRRSKDLQEMLQVQEAKIGNALSLIGRLKNSKRARLLKLLVLMKHPELVGERNVWSLLSKKLFQAKQFDPNFHIYNEIETILRQAPDAASESGRCQCPAAFRRSGPFVGTVVIFASIPFDDIGGGQRSAQLTRCLLQRMYRVKYLYAYPKVQNGREIFSEFDSPQFSHHYFENASGADIFNDVGGNDMAIFEIPHPDFIPMLEESKRLGLVTVYERIDPWEELAGSDWFSNRTEEVFIRSADRVCATAKVLLQKLVACGRSDAEYSPNAADIRYFNAMTVYPKPVDIPGNYRKTLVYFGSMYGNWFDWDALKKAAMKNRRNAFLLIGDTPADRHEMPDNVFFLGMKDNEELSAYLGACDAAIIPFVPSKLVDAVSPIKVFEYLFMKCPVITNRMPELDGYPGVSQASSPDEFADLCSLKHIVRADRSQSERFISRNDWNSRLDALVATRTLRHTYSIVIIFHNNERIIERCLETLLFHLNGLPVEVIAVDNASSDNGPAIVREKFGDRVKLIRNDRNGCSSGRNLGAAAARNEKLIFFDSDQWFTSLAWLFEYEFLADLAPQVGLFVWEGGWLETDDLRGRIVDYLPQRGTQSPEYVELGYRTDMHYAGAGGLFISKKLFEKVGGFDEKYDPTVFEDTDFSISVVDAGYKIAYRDFTGIAHEPNQTTRANENNREYQKLWARNMTYFKEKWSKKFDFVANPTTKNLL
ncbi:MAG: glycosyltransferase [Victivallaceae bacterium]|nr:glycosyltransferase [Victivallaceae bacterium]